MGPILSVWNLTHEKSENGKEKKKRKGKFSAGVQRQFGELSGGSLSDKLQGNVK
jgi:hypothetical protein